MLRGERQLDLTQREFELLEYLMRNERIVVSRQRLLDEVWGYDPFSMTNTIEVFVSNLRRKLEAGGEPRLLHTIRGAGYVLRVCQLNSRPRAIRRRGVESWRWHGTVLARRVIQALSSTPTGACPCAGVWAAAQRH